MITVKAGRMEIITDLIVRFKLTSNAAVHLLLVLIILAVHIQCQYKLQLWLQQNRL